MPGQIGDEYYFTKGHLHQWRESAEVYLVLSGEGFMLLEDEKTGESKLLPFQRDGLVYIPGHTAHRTINTGDSPLVYLGVTPARAGHDYFTDAHKNFLKVVVEVGDKPVLMDREDYLNFYAHLKGH